MARPNTPSVCFIGFGEAGQALAAGLRDAGVTTVAAWDILFPSPDGRRLCDAAEQMGVRRGTSVGDAVLGADLIVGPVSFSAFGRRVCNVSREVATASVRRVG